MFQGITSCHVEISHKLSIHLETKDTLGVQSDFRKPRTTFFLDIERLKILQIKIYTSPLKRTPYYLWFPIKRAKK